MAMNTLPTEELTRRFIDSATAAGASGTSVRRSAEDLAKALKRITAEEDAVLMPEPDFLSPDLFAIFRGEKKIVTNPTGPQITTIDACVTDAFCGIASTGSVCVPITKGLTSAVSVLSRRHVVVIDGDTIVLRPRDVFALEDPLAKRLRRNFSYVTGPSATADMGPLVIGVHGPGKLDIIILEELDGKH
jgi:L-lactate dehydrogenase complex protein LldG